MNHPTIQYNPYDFANPVTNKKLFSGRETELDEISYYLDHAVHAPRPMSLALIGNRASGKTSLLNIAEQEAEKRKFCTVRIDLDESHAKNELSFFSKFFDAIFLSAVSQGAYGGQQGKTFHTYLEMVTTNEIPEDKAFCPFWFPIQYAMATKAQRESVSLLDESIKHDMNLIRTEIDRPIIILMDECDILIKNAPILQKIRNIFMHMEGYMMLLAATPKLFPLLDHVFSPIIRQFKKINIEEFKNEDDTKRCMNRPLYEIDIDPVEVFSYETYEEVHELSGGKPYEINLICHVLFRHYQKNSQKQMILNPSVLENIRDELDKSQGLSQRRVLQAIKNLSRLELKGLGLLCRAHNSLTLEQLICIEQVFRGERRRSGHKIKQLYTNLKSKGIIGVDDHDRLIFLGDEFERIYTKYLAQEQGFQLRIDEVSPPGIWTLYETSLFRRSKIVMEPLMTPWSPKPDGADIDKIFKGLVGDNSDNVFDKYRWLAVNVYWLLVRNEQVDEVGILQMDTEFEWLSNVSWFYPQEPAEASLEHKLKEVCDRLASAVVAEDGKFRWSFEKIPVPPYDKMLLSVENAQEDIIRSYIARRHLRRSLDSYVEDRNPAAALWHADFARRLSNRVRFQSGELNNLGYMFLSNGQVDFAIDLLESAVDLSVEEEEADADRLLPLYNLGLAHLVGGEVPKAHEILRKVGEDLSEVSSGESLWCLLLPEFQADGIVTLTEEFNPDFHEVVQKILNILDLL